MAIRLIALDVDDTLLNSRGEITPQTYQAVQRALAQGIKVVLCSGRPLAGLQHYLDQLALSGANQYVITYNGAVIEDLTGQIVARHVINNQLYRELTSFGQAHHIPFNVLAPDSQIYTADHDVDPITVVQAWENQAGILIREPAELPHDFEIAKGLFVGEKTLLDEAAPLVEQAFGQQLYVVRAAANFLEVMSAGVNKGQALQDLATKLQLNAAEIMAVGDEQNDLPMFAFAGTAVAMANGSEIAKQQADFVTASNDDDGVAEVIEKLALKK
ncbi:Cof-type HAD-IIB family hydrolase [Lapidilactobacillus wuchangensis]|uniref:Cof-type HAD-IIB family hydrolase n=1 Tax=Lapidilactobacillus wuchangensis TaxID=2486001 RepID=UPI000F765F97|nr:Cof-type HAD-IIB family hydrolase [Lapidilactobacillus wuchangensis]